MLNRASTFSVLTASGCTLSSELQSCTNVFGYANISTFSLKILWREIANALEASLFGVCCCPDDGRT